MAWDWLSIARVSLALAFLCAASWQDLRSRTVDDMLWVAMGLLGLGALVAEMASDGARLAEYLLLYPVVLLYYDPYIDREPLYDKGKVCWPALIAFALAGLIAGVSLFMGGLTPLLVVPVMFLLVYLLYYANVIHGGADAKALMAIALLVPWYPALPGLPLVDIPSSVAEVMQVTFPFMLLVLMMGSAVVLLVPLYNIVVNVSRGDTSFPMLLFGRRMGVREAERSMVWPMERVVDGKVVRELFPKRGRDVRKDYMALRAAGIESVWVTPKIPFIVPLTFGLVISAIVGNVVFWIGTVFT